MVFSLDIRRALKGDCLLLHFGSSEKPGLVMIDGGPSTVYGAHLKPRLLEIRKARGLAAHVPLRIDLLIVSHVDDDHIQGLLDLTRELRSAAGVPLARIARLWHNSFDAIIDNDADELAGRLSAQFGPASLSGELPADATLDADVDEETILSMLKVLASIPQGHKLRLDAEALTIQPNPEFGGRLILAAKDEKRLPQGPTFLVAGPMEPELKALQKKHAAWLKELEEKGLTPEEALAAYADRSPTNLSSLVMLAGFQDKTILLTGDARGDKIITGLELAGALKKGGTLHVDVLKVPHHGSSNNVEREFFERITADHYVFSGDGQHGNPERDTFEMLLAARGAARFAIHLTYPVNEIDPQRKENWRKEQTKERAKNKRRQAQGKPPLPVRGPWSPARHSLAAFFKAHPLKPGQTLHVVQPNKPHVIDLLDPLGF